jgi:L,D-peptidoglycan transpeptidase YkuD (ErfK/YbiS/YcfS/YnhG family)
MHDKIFVSGNTLTFRGEIFQCAVGKEGFAKDKREGDHKTPLGIFKLRECWYRADKIAKPQTLLSLREILEDDGWCDDPQSPHYNLHVKLPFHGSHEKLWRDDNQYDIVIPLGYNDFNPTPGAGSAIFIHCSKRDYSGTEGCVALAREDLLSIMPHLGITTHIEITR